MVGTLLPFSDPRRGEGPFLIRGAVNGFGFSAPRATVTPMPDSILASHILLMYRGSSRSTATRTKEEAETQIAEIKQQLDAGADFEELAGKHSDCPSKSRGGDLGLFARGQMVPAFDQAAFALGVDQMSDIVETDFGYHIILRMG